jgi:hypothetical protein
VSGKARRRIFVILGSLAGVFLLAQLVQPEVPPVPAEKGRPIWENPALDRRVAAVLKRSCADCHSYETRWPWYSRISPGSWLMAGHVRRGRRQLNFSKQWSFSEDTLGDIYDAVNDRVMPPRSYLLLHRDARLSESDRTLLKKWALGEMPAPDAGK